VDPWLLILLTCVTAMRITRLIVADTFPPIAVQRQRLTDKYGEHSWQAYLLDCPWCMGFWVAGAVVGVVTAWYGLPAPLLVWATAAYVSGQLVALSYNDDEE
jgi:hypothetical protein